MKMRRKLVWEEIWDNIESRIWNRAFTEAYDHVPQKVWTKAEGLHIASLQIIRETLEDRIETP